MSEEKEQLEIDEANPVQAKEVVGVIDEKKLLRKLDLHLLPRVSLLSLLSFLDRSNGGPSPSSPRLQLIPFRLETQTKVLLTLAVSYLNSVLFCIMPSALANGAFAKSRKRRADENNSIVEAFIGSDASILMTMLW